MALLQEKTTVRTVQITQLLKKCRFRSSTIDSRYQSTSS